jgi:hypothetical protein
MLMASLSAPRMRRLLIPALLILGLSLRSYHYLRDRAVWQDEAGLLLTVGARGFHDLFLGRIDYHQAAPPLYLCALKTVGLILGDSSRALRLPSFLASCAALVLFLPVARRLLDPQAVPWAVLSFAASEQLLWHASEAKAYSVDVLAAVVVLAVPCCPRLDSPARQLLAYTLLAPLLLLFSYPASFLLAGLLLAYLPAVAQRKRGPTWLAYGTLAATMAMVLLWLLCGPVRCQHDAAIHSCWVACMPDWQRPWTTPVWLILSSFEVCRYCCKPLGQILAVLAVPGTLLLWRGGQRTMVRSMLAPILFAALASCAHRYPFGGARVMVYAAPAILLLAAAGVPSMLAWLRTRGRLAYAGLLALLVLPAAASLERVVHPWSEADIPTAADYVCNKRRADDFILGNDVAQQYYFRRLGSFFHLLDDTPLPSPHGTRLWIVMTAALPSLERVRMASQLAPAGWRPCQRREFAFTTVLLFKRFLRKSAKTRAAPGTDMAGAPAVCYNPQQHSFPLPHEESRTDESFIVGDRVADPAVVRFLRLGTGAGGRLFAGQQERPRIAGYCRALLRQARCTARSHSRVRFADRRRHQPRRLRQTLGRTAAETTERSPRQGESVAEHLRRSAARRRRSAQRGGKNRTRQSPQRDGAAAKTAAGIASAHRESCRKV